jgi:hypothetical protein
MISADHGEPRHGRLTSTSAVLLAALTRTLSTAPPPATWRPVGHYGDIARVTSANPNLT